LRAGYCSGFDEPANGVKIVQNRSRRSEISREGQQRTFLGIRLMVFFFLAAWAIVDTHMPPALAAAASQDAKSAVRGHDSEDPDAPLDGVEADIDANKFGETESRLKTYLTGHPDSSRAYYDLGYVQFRTHKIGSSIKVLSKSLELNPNNAEAHKVLALNCSIIGRYDLAEVELLEAARLKPESAEIHYFLARTYYTRGVYPLAKSEFETAIRLDPSYIKAYSNLGITLEALGNTDAALRNYTAAIQLEDHREQKSEWPYIYLSAFYNRQKNATEALNYAHKAMEINSASDTVYFEMAKAYRTQKQLQKAVEAARSAIAINSRVPDYYYVLGLVLRELGNQQESVEALEKYAQLQQHSNDALPEHETQEPLIAPEPQ
jgi:tetratricopeptide (TPR) repeat protein